MIRKFDMSVYHILAELLILNTLCSSTEWNCSIGGSERADSKFHEISVINLQFIPIVSITLTFYKLAFFPGLTDFQ